MIKSWRHKGLRELFLRVPRKESGLTWLIAPKRLDVLDGAESLQA